MKIQIAPTKRVKNVVSIWPVATEQADMIFNPNAPAIFPFNRDKVKVIYEFGALGSCAPEYIEKTIMQWLKALEPGGKLIICENNFEYISRLFVGGDITSAEFNNKYNQRSHMVRDDLVKTILNIGVSKDNIKVWNGHEDFDTETHEFVLEIKK